MKSIGLDIGTTSICGVIVSCETGEVFESVTKKNDSAMEGEESFSRLQDARKIRSICETIVHNFLDQYEGVVSLGVTGQMHGIVYLDSEGEPVSPLYSWQDERGNQMYDEKRTYSEFLTEETGYSMATGYGFTTHFYNQVNHQVPEHAAVLCTIPDYIAMYFGKQKRPLMHKSMAASLGFFQVEEGVWNRKAMKRVRIDQKLIPNIAEEKKEVWSGISDILVAPALGDNQASFLGSVGEGSNILINVGTGSQISIRTSEYQEDNGIEYRPYINKEYLMVGSSLCGGAAYALLKNFFQNTLQMFQCKVPDDMYAIMNQTAAAARCLKEPLIADTRFNGTRTNPRSRGSIQQISSSNFEPGRMTLAVLKGISQELYETYKLAPNKAKMAHSMIGSGNGIRQNVVLREEAETLFGKKLFIPRYAEEASVGSAFFSLYHAGIISDIDQIGKMIKLE